MRLNRYKNMKFRTFNSWLLISLLLFVKYYIISVLKRIFAFQTCVTPRLPVVGSNPLE